MKKIRLKHAVTPTVTNTIDPKDIPIADRGDWLRMTDGTGFTKFSDHPYRAKHRFMKNEAGTWVRVAARPMKIASSRSYKAPPAPANDVMAPDFKFRFLTASDKKWASEGLPIDVEFKNERIAGYLWQVADDFADCYETANIQDCRISERRVYARQVCQFLRFRMMHLWRPLVDATVFGKTMASIGREYGGNKEDSAKLGRQKVVDALMLARECFWDVNDLNGKAAGALRSDEPLRPNIAATLGRKSIDLPDFWHVAANDNRKAIKDVA